MKKLKTQLTLQNFLQFALIFVLVGSLRHVAWGFSTLETAGQSCQVAFIRVGDCGLFWGYFQALAIDLVLVVLSLAIVDRKKRGQSTRWYWAGVIGFVIVSIYANLLYGLVFSQTVPASADWPVLSRLMVYGKPFVLSGVLPIMLVYISHVISEAQGQPETPADVPPFAARRVREAQAGVLLDRWEQSNGTKTPTVAWLREQFGEVVGEALPVDEADGAIVLWRSAQGVSGRRPAEPGRNGTG